MDGPTAQHPGGPPVFYLLVCRECGDPERPLPIPFESAEARGKWAAAHTKGTGHDKWIVLAQDDDGIYLGR